MWVSPVNVVPVLLLEIKIKVHGYTFKGSNSVSFSFASLLNRGRILKEEFAVVGATLSFIPTALRKAKIVYKIVYNFGLSECKRVKR